MSVLDWLGLGGRDVADQSDDIHRIVRELEGMDPAAARYLALFASLLSRVAKADRGASVDETREMEHLVREFAALSSAEAPLVVAIARAQHRLPGGTEQSATAHAFRDLATEAQKHDLLHCLFAVSGAEESVSGREEDVVRTIARELLVSDDDYVAIRADYGEQCAARKRRVAVRSSRSHAEPLRPPSPSRTRGCATECHEMGADAAVEREAIALADEFMSRYAARVPEFATQMGYPDADHGSLTDNRSEAFRAWRDTEDRLLSRARAFPRLTLGSIAWLAHGTALAALEASVGMRACRPELWGVNSVGTLSAGFITGGWQSSSAVVAAVQPVSTPELRRAAVARLAALPGYVDREIENLREGIRLGFTATRDNVERVRAELDALLALAPAHWPHLSPAERDPAPGFHAELERIVALELTPAARRYRDFLVGEYLARARREPGVSALPGGEACYRSAIRLGTTLDLSPGEIHALGVAQIESIRAEMRAIAERSYATSDLPALLQRLGRDAEFRFRSSAEILELARSAVARGERAAPRAFARLPRGRVEVRPFADAQASAGASALSTGSMVGDRYAGIYFVNVWEATSQPRFFGEATAFHEAWPGHHLQGALAAENDAAPAITRHYVENAYAEGWALYSERLADELGLYTSDFDRLGMLSQQALRAARLVVDTGIHAFGWSRERAAAFMADAIGPGPEVWLPEIDRYSAWPGQALGYMVGALEIRRLREKARLALGPAFDLAGFHSVILDDGSVPLPMLREKVEAWIAARCSVPADRERDGAPPYPR